MVNTLDPMDLKQIITLHLEGYSNRKIGTSLSISRNTVNTYMSFLKGSDYTFKELLSLDTFGLETLFPSHTTITNERYDPLMSYFEGMNNDTLVLISLFLARLNNKASIKVDNKNKRI
jgi:hypothetical protein